MAPGRLMLLEQRSCRVHSHSHREDPNLVELRITAEADRPSCRATIVCFSHLRWNSVFQRPQHLLTRAARSYAVWYFEEPKFEPGGKPRLETYTDMSGVRVVTPVLPEGMPGSRAAAAQRQLLDQVLQAISSDTLIGWYYTPMALTFTRDLAFNACVYDNMDELSAFVGAPAEMLQMEHALFDRADVVFTGGHSLYEAKRHRHSNIHAFPSSVDTAHFAIARSREIIEPEDQAPIPHPRLGFFGVIDERFDVALLGALARLRSDWQFVMIGPVVKIDEATLPRLPNIHWLGCKLYSDLPRYLAGWNVGLMPFALNASTRFISPTKTPEFLAAGIPVVCSPIPDVVRCYGDPGLVQIATDAEDFASKAQALLGGQPRWLERVDAQLALSSWDTTWESMRGLVRRVTRKSARSFLAEAAE